MIQLFIFDMDGVLIDSEPAGTLAAQKALEDFGVHADTKDFLPFTGMGDNKFVGGVSEKYGIPFQASMKERMYDYYIMNQEAIRVFPWSKPVLLHLVSQGKKIAVASAADRRKVLCNLSRIGIEPSIFSAIVTGDMVTKNKPAPDIFLTVASLAGISPKECMVTEDAISGIMAAKAAGMKALAVTTSFPSEELQKAGADEITDDLSNYFIKTNTHMGR